MLSLDAENDRLRAVIDTFKDMVFGSRSEKLATVVADQLALNLADVVTDVTLPSAGNDDQVLSTFLAADLNACPCDILTWFVSRWQVEVTFAEVRAHLGVETQRQWSDKAILRTTPALFGLFSIVTLWAHDLSKSQKLKPRASAWYPKAVLTFSDAIAAVRREIWHHQISFMSRPSRDSIEIPRHIWQRMENALAHAA